MASVYDLEVRLDGLAQSLEMAKSRLETEEINVARWRERIERAKAQGDQAQIALFEQNLARSQANLANAQTSVQNYQERVATTQSELEQAKTEEQKQQQVEADTKEKARQDAGPQTVSAGELQKNQEVARDDEASTQNPPTQSQVITTEGRIVPEEPTVVGTNAEPTTTQETVDAAAAEIPPAPPTAASAPANQSGTEPPPAPTTAGPQPQRQPDEAVPANAVQAEITQRYQEPLKPRPNILDQYASYTYSISIYLMTPQSYTTLLTARKKSIVGMPLLIQSGGADIGSRSEFFDLDFYIDNLVLNSVIQGKGTRTAHNITELQFRITEPNGITLLSRLFRAAQKYIGGNPDINKNYASQLYLMVIRFYGYDANGQRISPQTTDPQGLTDRQAIIEKFVPFRFTDIKFRVSNRLTEYECKAVAPQNDVNTGRARGILPFALQVQGGTLEGLLKGPVTSNTNNSSNTGNTSTTQTDPGEVPGVTVSDRNQTDPGEVPGVTVTPAPATAGSASPKTYTSGLEQALNQYQAKFVTDGIYDVADRYFFKVIDNSLRNAQIQPRGPTDLARTAQNKPTTAAEAKDGKKQNVATNSKYVSGYPGQSITQFLDLLVRSSTFIYDQQVVIETTSDGKKVQRAASTPAWYHIGLEARPRKYDDKRGDYAFDFTYTINIYKINEMVSDYFPNGRFNGSHKAYEYWFTGQNTQILSFEQDYNYLYYLTVNSANLRNINGTGRLQEVYKRAFAAQSGESKQGSPDNTGEAGANAADFLYSPGDLARARLTIVGDPDWIQQGTLWAGVGDVSINDAKYVNFLSDGSVNYDTQEILFSIGWNQPADYDLSTGLIKIKKATF